MADGADVTRRAVDILATLPPSVRAINPSVAAPSRRRAPRKPAKIAVVADDSWVLIDGLRLDVTMNTRGHHMAKARKIAAQRTEVSKAIDLCDRPTLPCVVTITRRSPGTLDDDNAVSSAKATRDAVAQWLGVDDADRRVTWVVEQERGPWGVRVVVRPVAPPQGAATGRDG